MLAFGTLMYSINLSSNFFVYKYLLWKERRTLEKSEFYVNMETTILWKCFRNKRLLLKDIEHFVFLLSGRNAVITCIFNSIPEIIRKYRKSHFFLLNLKFKMNNTTEEPSSLNTAQWVMSVICLAYALIGIVSNIVFILTLKQKDTKIRFNCLMILRAMFDLTTFFTFICNAISYIAIHEHNVLESMILFLDSVAFNCSAFTMITIALERYLVLCMNK